MKTFNKLMSIALMMSVIVFASCSEDEPAIEPPAAGFTFETEELTVTFTDASLDADSYAWDFGDNSGTSDQASPTYTYAESGDFEVSLTVTNAGGTDISTETVSVAKPVNPIETIAGRWMMSNSAGALGVGPSVGDVSWWSNSADDLTLRDCYFDDVYVFGADGSFSLELGSDTWIEEWQGSDPPSCGAGVSPHDGTSTAYTVEVAETTFTVNGKGAYVGLAKANNAGELSAPADAPESITYTYTLAADGNSMDVYVEAGAGVFWQYKLEKQQ